MAGDPGKLVGRARGIVATSIRAVRTRMELLAVEIQETGTRAIRDLLIAGMALNFVLFGLLLGAVWIVLAVPAELRRFLLGFFSLAFLICGAGALLWLRSDSAGRKPFLHATLTILKGDEQALDKKHPDEQT
ncbi:uncharacterized protein E1O_00300 [Burkholderiales bacterium GJ-E10]|nr:uncharacterized protein E1O_00300 [Burkholderiales bacterium GJ-E10]